jgi:hypothetical protein
MRSTIIQLLIVCTLASAAYADSVGGTLVIGIPVNDGLVVCADKRLYNSDAQTFTDDYVKIRKAGDSALFAATHTIGFYDRKNKRMGFNAFDTTEKYLKKNSFSPTPAFWSGLKREITTDLKSYFSTQKFADLPATDTANKGLLFNLIFYSLDGGKRTSYTLRVFYRKAQTPIVFITDPIFEEVRSPQLSGKGRDVMKYLATNSKAASDPTILRFDERIFSADKTTREQAVTFSAKLFDLTNRYVPLARVSSTYDCVGIVTKPAG